MKSRQDALIVLRLALVLGAAAAWSAPFTVSPDLPPSILCSWSYHGNPLLIKDGRLPRTPLVEPDWIYERGPAYVGQPCDVYWQAIQDAIVRDPDTNAMECWDADPCGWNM